MPAAHETDPAPRIYIEHGDVIRGPFKTWAEANKAMIEGTGPWKPKGKA